MSSLGSSGDVYAETLAVFDQREDSTEPLTTPEVADSLDAARRTVYKRLEKLAIRGDLKTKKAGANARVWWRPLDGSAHVASTDERGQRRNERELEEYRRQYRTLIENFPSGAVALVDQNMRYVAFGGTPEGETDVTRADLEGEPVREVLPSKIAEVVVPRYEAALNGEASAFEDTIDERVYQFHFLPVRDDQGDVFAVTAMSQDITDRKRAEEDLLENEAWLSEILEQLPAAVGVFDTDGHFRLQNDRMRKLAMGDRIPSRNSETRGEWIAVDEDGERLPPEQWPGARALRGEAVSPGIEFRFEGDDETRWMDVAAVPVSESGERTEASVVIQDITARKERERQLEESKNRYQALVDNFPNGLVALFDEDLRYHIAGGQLYDSLGRDPAETVGRTLYEVATPEQTELLEPNYRATLNGESHSFEIEHDDRALTVLTTPVTDEGGDVIAGMAMFQDVTERQEREQKLRETAESLDAERTRLETILEQLPVGVWISDEHGEIVRKNEEADRIWAGDAPLPESIDEYPEYTAWYADRDQQLTPDEYPAAKALRTNQSVEPIELRIRRLNDSIGWVLVSAEPITDEDGRVTGAVSINVDITERKQRERELAALNRLNSVFQDVTHAIIESSSREDIEQTITEHLRNSDSYEYAWIGHLDRHGESIIPQTADTNEADLSEIPLSSAPDNPTSQPPAVEAIRTGDVQVSHDTSNDPRFDQWTQSQDIRYRAEVSIPITYEDRVYGVLNVYTVRENAFDEHERHLIGRLGEVVGHAITAIERKRALLEDRVQEITFQSQRFAEVFTDAAGDESFTISIEKFVPLPDDQSIAYYALDGLDPAAFIDVIETFNPDAESHVTDEEGSRARVEVQGSDLTLASELGNYNSQIVDGTLQNGEFRLRVQVPQHSHVRAVKDVVKEAYPDAEVVAQTEVEQGSPRLSDVFSDLDDQLTERQRTALEVAYYSGYFDWPRAITGEELAERLDVTQGTVSHHIRHGERKLVSAFFDSMG